MPADQLRSAKISGVVVSTNRNLTFTSCEFWAIKITTNSTAIPSAHGRQELFLTCG